MVRAPWPASTSSPTSPPSAASTSALLVTERDELRTCRNTISKEVGKLKASGGDATAPMAQSKAMATASRSIEDELAGLDQALNSASWPSPTCPWTMCPRRARGQRDRQKPGDLPKLEGFAPWPTGTSAEAGHLRPGPGHQDRRLRLHPVRRRRLALVRSLINWFLDVQTGENGYTESLAAVLVERRTMTGTGQLPKFEEELYKLSRGPST